MDPVLKEASTPNDVPRAQFRHWSSLRLVPKGHVAPWGDTVSRSKGTWSRRGYEDSGRSGPTVVGQDVRSLYRTHSVFRGVLT